MPARQRPKSKLPIVWLMTDERIDDERLLRGIARLPRGSGILFRHYRLAEAERRALFDRVRLIARRRHLTLFLAGSDGQARAWGADGSHGAEPVMSRQLPRSAPVHHHRELRVAVRQRADMLFVSPLFATQSHPGSRPLGPFRFAMLVQGAGVPVMALGGVGRRHGRLIRALGAAGFGAIDSLT